MEFSEQFLYGHREVVISYANLDERAMLLGSIEHGWALDSGEGIRKLLGGRYTYLSWSLDRMSRSNVENSETIAFGAPFIYAHELVSKSISDWQRLNSRDKSRTLFFPVHGNEFSQQNAESQINLFSEDHDPAKSSVSLYWVEYVNPEIYNAYKEAGFKIFCAGFSGQMEHTGLGYSARKLAGSPIGGRPSFLINTIGLLATHQKIVFGAIGSSLFYAAYMGKEIKMLHKYLDTEYLDMDYEFGNSFRTNKDEVRYVKFLEEQMNSSFAQINFSSEKFRSLAKSELGFQHFLSPFEMRAKLQGRLANIANPQSIKVFNNSISDFSETLRRYSE